MSRSIRTREWVRRAVPWWAKFGLKLALACLPLGYGVLRAASLARHGGMERPAYAYRTFRRHFDGVPFHRKAGGFTVLELGPGDSLFTALIARAHGAASTCLVDVAPLASRDPSLYREMARHLADRGLAAPDLAVAAWLQDVLRATNARYETGGLASLRALVDRSFDFIFSNSVLQHVRRSELMEMLREMRRLVHPAGCAVHSVDLRDTMGQSLHHLRFRERGWESAWFRRAGFYTNRVRASELMAMCRRAGFRPEFLEVNRFAEVPVPRRKLADPYRSAAEEDLVVATIRVALWPVPSAEARISPCDSVGGSAGEAGDGVAAAHLGGASA